MPATIASFTDQRVETSANVDAEGRKRFTVSRIVTLSEAVSDIETVRALVEAQWPIGSAGSGGTILEGFDLGILGPKDWEIVFDFATPVTSSAGSGGGGGGVDFISVVRYGKWSVTKVAQFDGRANPAGNNPNGRTKIANTVGDRFTPHFMLARWYPTISIDYMSGGAGLENLDHVGSVNGSSFTLLGKTIPAFCAMFADFSTEQIGPAKFKHTYTFHLNYEKPPPGFTINGATYTGFIEWVLNMGVNKLVGGNRVPIYLNNEPITEPVLLDAAGAPVADSGYAGHYLDFLPYKQGDFVSLFPHLDTNPYA